MKRISSQLILLTLLLVVVLISVNSLVSLKILRSEIGTYTLQNEQLQTQALSSRLELEFSHAQDLYNVLAAQAIEPQNLNAHLTQFLEDSKKGFPALSGVGVYLKDTGTWAEVPENSISTSLPGREVLSELHSTFVSSTKDSHPEHVVYYPSQNAVIAIRLNLDKVKNDCSGLDVAVYNRSGQPIFFCDEAAKSVLSPATAGVKSALKSEFKSGAFTAGDQGFSGLYAFADLSSFGKVISVTDTLVAYRPAFILAERIFMLVLASIGIAILASVFLSRKVVGPIMLISSATRKIANGEFDTPVEINTHNELGVLAQSVQSMAQKLKVLIATAVDKAKLDTQLEVASAVQRIFIPGPDVQIDPYRVLSYYRPADQCGGDWWGYVTGRRKVAILAADVTGHGYASAMLVAVSRGCVAMIQNEVNKIEEIHYSSGEILAVLSHAIFESTKGELSMTAVCVILDLETGEFQYSNGGHCPMYLLNSASLSTETLSARGPRLGELAHFDSVMEEKTGILKNPADRLIIYTDGVMDLGVGEETLGRKGLKKFLQKHVQADGNGLIQALEKELIPLNQGAPLVDDVTFLVLQKNG